MISTWPKTVIGLRLTLRNHPGELGSLLVNMSLMGVGNPIFEVDTSPLSLVIGVPLNISEREDSCFGLLL